MKIPCELPDVPNFHINSSYQTFTDRQKSVFDQLDTIPLTKLAPCDDGEHIHTTEHSSHRSPVSWRKETKYFSGKESIFKQPLPPTPRSIAHKVPDHQMNPHKWTKYSLDDVSNEDMSDRTNTATAMSFLKELSSRNEHNLIPKLDEKLSDKIIFKKVKSTAGEPSSNAPTFHASKLVMPEYAVGQKIKREHKFKETCNTKVGSHKQLKLDHLEENDDEDEMYT